MIIAGIVMFLMMGQSFAEAESVSSCHPELW